MGRHSTGAITTREAMRLELSYLLKKGYIKKGCNIVGSVSWNSGSSIKFESNLEGDNSYAELRYTITDYRGTKKRYKYRIQIAKVPSNLGKGELLYFVCPVNGKKCRILYNCYHSGIFKSREAYQNRIYYDSQVQSKLYYNLSRYWELERQIDKLYKQRYSKGAKSHYRGKPTKLQQKIDRLEEKQDYHDKMRWSIMPKSVRKILSL